MKAKLVTDLKVGNVVRHVDYGKAKVTAINVGDGEIRRCSDGVWVRFDGDNMDSGPYLPRELEKVK